MKLKRWKAILCTLVMTLMCFGVTIPAKAAEQTGEKHQEDNANSFRYKNGEPIGNEDADHLSSPQELNTISYMGSYLKSSVLTKGIDVSTHNGSVDWKQVKNSGLVDFVIIRCGYGDDYTDQDDARWVEYTTACEKLGIPYGVYLYSYATDLKHARSEAAHVLRLLAGRHPSMPVYLDMEDISTAYLDKELLAGIANTFCNTVSAAGYDVGVYSSYSWWVNQLNTSVFDNPNWSKWVAQWNDTCSYKKPYDMWQYSENGQIPGMTGTVDLNVWVADNKAESVADKKIISYRTNILAKGKQVGGGWQSWVENGVQSNTVASANRLDALQIKVGSGYGDLSVAYRAYNGVSWGDVVLNGTTAGTPGKNTPIQAIKIKLVGSKAANYDIYYRVKSYASGWSGWAKNGEKAGTEGFDRYAEAIQIVAQKKTAKAPVGVGDPYKRARLSYRVHVKSYGWLSRNYDSEVAGAVGLSKQIEALQIKNVSEYKGNVYYSTYARNDGWQKAVKNDETSGVTGQGSPTEAIKIKLTGELEKKFDVWYHVYYNGGGWMGWASNGEPAGMVGYGKRLEAIEIRLVKKGGEAPGSTDNHYLNNYEREDQSRIVYQTHIQSIGWELVPKVDGEVSGTTGQAKRLEAIKICKSPHLSNIEGDVQYRVSCEDYGWLAWVKNGAVSGTSGESKRMEAIRIRLTGKLAEKYDVYYRVHAQRYGWLAWTKNGKTAGTTGYGCRLEALQIKMVKKGESAPTEDSVYTQAYMHPLVSYRTHVQRYGWLDNSFDGEESGTTGEGLRMESIEVRNETGVTGDIKYRVHCQTYGWTGWRKNGAQAGTVGEGKRLEAIRIVLTDKLAEQYDVYYRVHAQTYGWLGWAKNGNPAGTEGLAKRLESVQIVLVKKGGKAPGSTKRAFIKQ